MLYASLLFPGINLKTFRRFLDPHFSLTEVYEVYVVSVNLETISIRQGPGRVRLLIHPLVLVNPLSCISNYAINLTEAFV